MDYDQATAVLTSLAAALSTQPRLRAYLEGLVRQASGLLPSTPGAAISMLVDSEPTTVAVTDHVTLEVDLVQYDNLAGLRLGMFGSQPIRVALLAADEQFLHHAAGAAGWRVLNVLSIPIGDDTTRVGTLDVYSRDTDGFDAPAKQAAQVLASEAAAALVQSALYDRALSIRQLFQEAHDVAAQTSMAQGVLMETHDCNASQALALIRRASAANNESLVDSAKRVLSAE